MSHEKASVQQKQPTEHKGNQLNEGRYLPTTPLIRS